METAPDPTKLIERLMVGTPARVIDAAVRDDADARREIDATREAVALIALSLTPTQPPDSLRARIEATLAHTAQPRLRRAVLVLDMLVDHLSPGRPLEVPRARGIVAAVAARIEAARHAGEPVVFLCDRHAPDDPELLEWGAHSIAGTPGAEVVAELAPRDGERVIPHRTYSAFFESDLADTLHSLSVDTVVITGCITELGIFATATDALMRGYDVEIPPACQAGTSSAAEQLALRTLSVMRPVKPMPAPR